MSHSSRQAAGPGFREGYRGAGVLLHPTSLPGRYGIGDLGPAAHEWVDALVQAGQSWWQFLPLGDTLLGDSPYSPLSSFGGNPLLISPDRLVEDGLLSASELAGVAFPDEYVDYGAVRAFKGRLLAQAYERFRSTRHELSEAFDEFCQTHVDWLEDFALFVAIKARQHGAAYRTWAPELTRREPAALDQARRELADPVDRVRFAQFLVFRQAHELVEHARRVGLRLFADLPIFVSDDSVDVWSHPELFLLDENCNPKVLAGVPPDYFSPTGQLWGNPQYDWEVHRRTSFAWWTRRISFSLEYVDLLRIDHFRGFAAAWHVPAGAATAVDGHWVPGSGPALFAHLEHVLGGLPLVAEDLGHITKDVEQLRDQFHLPGMRVLHFAFDGDPNNPFLPHRHVHNAVAYTGTHDNNTTRGWYADLPAKSREALWKLIGRPEGREEEVTWELIRLAQESVAALAVVPLQDLLNLGAEARMNVPGLPEGNWRWRFTHRMGVPEALARLRELTIATHRGP